MAHEIDTTTGQAAVFTTVTPPWHGLGTVIENAATSREAIALACLHWTVEQWPIETVDPNTQVRYTADRHVANVRTDTNAVLGVVGKQYHPFQNRDAFEFMDSIVGDKLAMFETAGALRDGRIVWMLARIPREYRAGSDDVIKPYVLLVNSHDGSSALRMIATTVRVVCMNTLHLALSRAAHTSSKGGSKGEGISIRHRPNLEERVREAREKLGIVAARFDQFDEELHRMLDRQMRSLDLRDYFHAVLPTPADDATERKKRTHRDTIRQFHENFENESNSLAGVRGSVWAAYNAVSEWADHQRRFRGKGEQQRAENRLNSTWFGSSHQIKQRAYTSAMAVANSN